MVDAVADFGGAGEGQFVQVRVVKEPLTGFGAFAGDDVQYALRKYILDETGEFHEGEGCVGRWFNDDGVSGCQGRSQFPACHGEGEVPGNDLAYDTYRFMENEGQGVVVQHGGRAFPCTEAACEVAEMVAAQGNIGSFGFTNRFAVVQCFHQCQVVCIGINNNRFSNLITPIIIMS